MNRDNVSHKPMENGISVVIVIDRLKGRSRSFDHTPTMEGARLVYSQPAFDPPNGFGR